MSAPFSSVCKGGGCDRRLREECFGGLGGRVVVECVPLVKRRDILVVVVDDFSEGATGGERGMNLGRSGLLPLPCAFSFSFSFSSRA